MAPIDGTCATAPVPPRQGHAARAFLRDETAPTAIEYALMAMAVAVVIVAVVFLIGDRLAAFFGNVTW